MEPGRRPAPDQRHTARHSTGGFLGSRSARVVAAGLTVTAGLVGGVVVVERIGSPDGSASQAQVSPPVVRSPPRSTASALPAPTPTSPVTAASAEPGGTPGSGDPAQLGETAGPAAPGDPARPRGTVQPEAPAAVGGTPARPEPAQQEPVEQEPVEQEPVEQEPVEQEPVAPAERVLLQTTVDVPDQWQIPSGAVSLDVPLPDPVTVTGAVASPEPGRLDVELTVRPGARHLAEDPAPAAAGAAGAARHRADAALPG